MNEVLEQIRKDQEYNRTMIDRCKSQAVTEMNEGLLNAASDTLKRAAGFQHTLCTLLVQDSQIREAIAEMQEVS